MNIGEMRNSDFRQESLRVEERRQVAEIDMVETRRYHDPCSMSDHIIASLKVVLKNDSSDTVKNSDFSKLEILDGIRATMKYRMFGARFTDKKAMPVWMPDWLKDSLLVKIRTVVTKIDQRITITHNRMCPHVVNNEQAHINFLFGENLNESVSSELLRKARSEMKGEIRNFLCDLITTYEKRGQEVTGLSLGKKEMYLMDSECRDMRASRDSRREFLGIPIEEVDKATYLAIY